MKRPIRAFAAVLAVGALALSACGSSDDDSSDTSSDTTVAAETDNGSTKIGADCDMIDASGGTGDWELVTSSTPAMLTELEASLENCEPIIVTLWHPHWAYASYSIKDLEDPEGAMGEGEDIITAANAEWAEENENLAAAFEKFEMSDEELAGLEVYTETEYEGDPAAGAQAWLDESDDASITEDWVADLEDGDGMEVTIAIAPGWAEDVAVTHVWAILLEEKGYEVDMPEIDVGPLFEGMASGDIDVFFDMWLPVTHQDYWDKNGDKLVKLGNWFGGSATLNIAVPSYMNIDSMADIDAWADDVDSTITGIDPGAGLTRVTACDMIPGYDLGSAPTDDTCVDS